MKRGYDDTIAISSKKPKIIHNQLPPEIWLLIYEFLPKDSFQNIRILSRLIFNLPWKNVLKDYLFSFSGFDLPFEKNDFSFVNRLELSLDDPFVLTNKTKENLHHFKIFKEVLLSNSLICDEDLKVLLSDSQIESLTINFCSRITNQGLQYCSKLKRLSIADNPKITDEGMKYLSNIEELNISRCPLITDEGFKYLSKVKTLCLFLNEITDQALSHLKSIKKLEVYECNNLTNSCFEYLKGIETLCFTNEEFQSNHVGLKPLKGIKSLCLIDSTISDDQLQYLEGIENLEFFRDSKINGSGFSYLKGIKFLTLESAKIQFEDEFKHLKGLEELVLDNCKGITDQCLKYVSGVKKLSITHCYDVTDEGIKHLYEIRDLDISFCRKITGSSFEFIGNKIQKLTLSSTYEITEVEYNNNHIKDSFLYYIDKYLKGNLQELNLPQCPNISNQGIKYLSGIEKIDIRECYQIDYQGISQISGPALLYVYNIRLTRKEMNSLKEKGINLINDC